MTKTYVTALTKSYFIKAMIIEYCYQEHDADILMRAAFPLSCVPIHVGQLMKELAGTHSTEKTVLQKRLNYSLKNIILLITSLSFQLNK